MNKILLGDWKSEPTPLSCDIFPRGRLLPYTQTLEPIAFPDTYGHDLVLNDLRKAAETHRQVRRYIQPLIKPGLSLTELCTTLENKTKSLLEGDSLHSGIGFPTGVSINNCAAHDSAVPGDTRVIGENDVIKVDFGTHVNGYIIDSAFTVAFDEKYEPLLKASIAGTWAGIKMAGPDVPVGDLSREIQETIESYEIELDGKTYPIRAVRNLGGHDILPYKIHGGTLILGAPNPQTDDMRMQAGKVYAIETFASTGRGLINHDTDLEISHYMRMAEPPRRQLRLKTSRQLLGHINRTKGSLPFCTRWLENDFKGSYRIGLKELERVGIISSYEPLSDVKGSYTSQLEHTIYLHEFGKEVLSIGDDY